MPRDFPRQRLAELKRLESARREQCERAPSARELELEHELRTWPRDASTDPYRAGVLGIAEDLRRRISPAQLHVAFNEFCAPSVPEALETAIRDGCRRIVVISTMLTPGGSHSEIEIPEAIAEVRAAHPDVEIVYAWPFEPARVAEMLATKIAAAAAHWHTP